MCRTHCTHLSVVPKEVVVRGELEILSPGQLGRLLVGEETRSDLRALSIRDSSGAELSQPCSVHFETNVSALNTK